MLDADGVEREVDTIILGTGFHVSDPPVADQVRGRDGRLMREAWEGTPRAYLGNSVPGFPNLFLLLGPQHRARPQLDGYMIETQVEHVLRAIQAMERSGASNDRGASPGVRGRSTARSTRACSGTVWDSGCASFYLDVTGRNGVLWPDWTWRFRRLATRFDESAYTLAHGPAEHSADLAPPARLVV